MGIEPTAIIGNEPLALYIITGALILMSGILGVLIKLSLTNIFNTIIRIFFSDGFVGATVQKNERCRKNEDH